MLWYLKSVYNPALQYVLLFQPEVKSAKQRQKG